ncbi:MAG: ATP-binding cassette domain-containing protein [Hyphomicrobiales bacterium]|nr:ATP-binding cassette domain-containing protein [Hyphomicrobiales bacterium]
MIDEPLLRVDDLSVTFHRPPLRPFGKPSTVRAVDGVSFTLARGETLGLVGESGCGKSTTGNALVQLIEPSGGRIMLDGDDISSFRSREDRLKARRRGQMIFQDAYASLDPRMTIEDILQEPMRIHALGNRQERSRRIQELLDQVGLAQSFRKRYPHEMSGGQLQRIGIARALAVEPDFIVCDEPVSALDVSIQAQIINLLEDLQAELKIALIFISHDLSVVQHISHRIAVMYLGRIVEQAPADTLYDAPRHPYTKALLSAISVPDPVRERENRKNRILLHGEAASPDAIPTGCRFRSRCPIAGECCATMDPALAPLPVDSHHDIACVRVLSGEAN